MKTTNTILKLMFIAALIWVLSLPNGVYEGFGKTLVVEAAEFGPHRSEVIQPVIWGTYDRMTDVEYLEISGVDRCSDLSFHSYSDGSIVNPPTWYVEQIKDYSCNDKKILSRIAYYESRYNRNSVNLSNPYARGLYHVLPSTRGECRKFNIEDEQNCALWVMKERSEWYFYGYRIYGLEKSFLDLI